MTRDGWRWSQVADKACHEPFESVGAAPVFFLDNFRICDALLDPSPNLVHDMHMKRTELDPANPIVAAVLPLKGAAQDRAEVWAHAKIAAVLADLESGKWNLDTVAPRGQSMKDSRDVYRQKMAKHELYRSLTRATWTSKGPRDPDMRERHAEKETRYVAEMRKLAGEQYVAFIFKMLAKIGEVASASIRGNHVWGESFLTVTRADGSREVWKTQQIVNISKLGTLFNQWPSRKMKS